MYVLPSSSPLIRTNRSSPTGSFGCIEADVTVGRAHKVGVGISRGGCGGGWNLVVRGSSWFCEFVALDCCDCRWPLFIVVVGS